MSKGLIPLLRQNAVCRLSKSYAIPAGANDGLAQMNFVRRAAGVGRDEKMSQGI
jgi:hypothetical protein